MKFIVVERMPETVGRKVQSDKKKLIDYIEEFMAMNVKMVRVDYSPDEYKTIASAYTAVQNSCKYYRFPIDVHRRNGELYLVRRDI